MLGSMMTYYRAWENRRFVRRLLREKQPELAAVLESVVREPPCSLCHDSQCSMASRFTFPQIPQIPQIPQLLQPSQPRRQMALAGHADRMARPSAAALPNSVNVTL